MSTFLTEGYWISPEGKIIEIREHFSYVRDHPKAFGFTAGEAKTWTTDDRERVIRAAVQRGWIRVRGHKRYMTFEPAELTQDAIFSITELLRKQRIHPDERVRVHELSRGRGFEQTADYFLTGQALAAARNRPRRRRAARPNVAVLPNRGKLYRDGSRFIPTGKPTMVGARPNPTKWQSWGRTTKASILVGLKAGRNARGFRKGDAIPERLIYRMVFGIRTEQVGREYGASFVRQRGHYIPEKARRIGAEPTRREPSVQVIVFPGEHEKWTAFRRHIRFLANEILDWLAQESVIIEYVRNGRIMEVGKLVWKTKKR